MICLVVVCRLFVVFLVWVLGFIVCLSLFLMLVVVILLCTLCVLFCLVCFAIVCLLLVVLVFGNDALFSVWSLDCLIVLWLSSSSNRRLIYLVNLFGEMRILIDCLDCLVLICGTLFGCFLLRFDYWLACFDFVV